MIYLLLISVVIGVLISQVTNSRGFEFVNPIWLYKKYRVNWFGAAFLAIIFNILAISCAVCYWIYKLCTVGRK